MLCPTAVAVCAICATMERHPQERLQYPVPGGPQQGGSGQHVALQAIAVSPAQAGVELSASSPVLGIRSALGVGWCVEAGSGPVVRLHGMPGESVSAHTVCPPVLGPQPADGACRQRTPVPAMSSLCDLSRVTFRLPSSSLQ